MRCAYYLLFFNETESYQIVARSSIKKIDDQGSAAINIRNKLLKGLIIVSGEFLNFFYYKSFVNSIFIGTFEECEKEMNRRTLLSQQSDNNIKLLFPFSYINYFLLQMIWKLLKLTIMQIILHQ